MTLAYFAVIADGVTPMLSTTDVLVVTGKPLPTLTPATGTDALGSYESDNLPTYSASAHFNVTLYNKQCVLLKEDSGASSQFAIYLDNDALKGKRLKDISIYHESTYDDGQATQVVGGSTVSFIKYVATIE